MSSDSKTDRPAGNPFRLTTVALVIVLIVVVLVFVTRQMERDVSDRERMDAARSEVEAVALFLEEGDVPNAVLALHDIGLRLDRVDGAEAAAEDVVASVNAEYRSHAATREELAQAGREIAALEEQLTAARGRTDFVTEQNRGLAAVRDMNALILRNAAEGRTPLARRLLDAIPKKDIVAEAAETLVARVEALAAAGGASGAERIHALRTLARTWPGSGVGDFADLAAAEDERRRRAGAALAAAEQALDRGDVAAADAGLTEAVKAAEVAEVRDLTSRLTLLLLQQVAATREKEGNLVEAAAAYRVSGDVEKADVLERKATLIEIAGFLSAKTEDFRSTRRFFEAAGCLELSHRITRDPRQREESMRMLGQGWLLRAEEYRKLHQTDSAIICALRAEEFLPQKSAEIIAEVRREDAGRKRDAALAEAETVLEAGAPALAARKVKDLEVPKEFIERIEAARRQVALGRARAALQAGDGKTALAQLREIGHEGPPVPEAELLAGDVSKGAAGLTGSKEMKSVTLLAAGWTVVSKDAARAARLGLEALDLTGSRPASVALLTEALAAAGDPPKGDELWDAVRAVIFAATAGGMGER